MPRGLALGMQRVWHCFCLNVGGSGIGNTNGSGIVIPVGILNAKGYGIGIPRGLALVQFECQWVWQRECQESTIGFISMPEGLALISFLAFLITALRAIVQSDCRVASNHPMGRYADTR